MLRSYLLIIVLVGLGSAFLTRPSASTPASRERGFSTGTEMISSTDGQPDQVVSQSINQLDQSIELTRDQNGYFFADVRINGAPVHMLVDTGATTIALTRDDARMAGLATSIGMHDVIGEGADGAVRGENVTLDRVTLGEKTVERVPAIVLSSGGTSLLGQSFLSQFASVKIEGDKMVLR